MLITVCYYFVRVIILKFLEDVAKEKYQSFTSNHEKSHFLQSYEWGEFCKKIKGQTPHYVGMTDDNGQLVATALILERKTPLGFSYGYAPRGFIIDYTNKELIKKFTEYLKEYMKKNKFIYIKFDPDIPYQDIDQDANPIERGNNNYELYNYMLSLGYIHTGFYRLYEGNQPRYTFRIDLKRDWDVIESRMSKSFLQSVKRSYQYDLEIDNEIKIKEFYKLIKNTSERDGFNPHDEKYYETLVDEFKDNIKFFNVTIDIKKMMTKIKEELKDLKDNIASVNKKKLADYNDKIKRLEKEQDLFSKYPEEKRVICTIICISTKNRIWSFFQGGDELAGATCAVMRCYYEAIKDAFNKGYDFFDLFGTPGDPHTTYKNLAKLHDFKRKYGDKYIEFIGEFDLVNKKILYKMLPTLLGIYRKLRR